VAIASSLRISYRGIALTNKIGSSLWLDLAPEARTI
jgi:hypothetical protein